MALFPRSARHCHCLDQPDRGRHGPSAGPHVCHDEPALNVGLGNKTPKTVPGKFNLGTQKEWSVSNYTLTLRVDYEHRGRKYWDTSNVGVINPVDLLGARAYDF